MAREDAFEREADNVEDPGEPNYAAPVDDEAPAAAEEFSGHPDDYPTDGEAPETDDDDDEGELDANAALLQTEDGQMHVAFPIDLNDVDPQEVEDEGGTLIQTEDGQVHVGFPVDPEALVDGEGGDDQQ